MNEVIIIDGREYDKNDPYLVTDVITGEYFHRKIHLLSSVPMGISLRRKKSSSRALDRHDNATYNIYDLFNGYISTHRLNNIRASGEYDPEYSLQVSTLSTGTVMILCNRNNKDKTIKELGLVRGILNPDCYYDPYELELMDKARPYRKFDNTYKKLSINSFTKNQLTVEQTRSSEVRGIMKNVLKRNIDMGVESLTYKDTENLKYTFGVELETCNGRLEANEVEDLNVKAVHDGSLREADGSNPIGGEYVTGVLVGDSGLHQLYEICRVLQTKCSVDKRCGVHVHIGSLNWSKEEVVYSYILGELIEKDFFSILPKSRRDNSYCRPINKILTKSIKELTNIKSNEEYEIKINELYDIVFMEVSGVAKSEIRRYNKQSNHPKGSKCGYDKNAQRYCWLNYVTLLFNTKGVDGSHTLEFRPMSGTLNYTKVKNYLKICMAFCAFVENYKSLIRNGLNTPITLETIVSKVYPKTGDKLISYIKERRETFLSADESIDYATDSKLSKKSIKEVVCA